jgi:hypothetical protein
MTPCSPWLSENAFQPESFQPPEITRKPVTSFYVRPLSGDFAPGCLAPIASNGLAADSLQITGLAPLMDLVALNYG